MIPLDSLGCDDYFSRPRRGHVIHRTNWSSGGHTARRTDTIEQQGGKQPWPNGSSHTAVTHDTSESRLSEGLTHDYSRQMDVVID